jgi:hypothetical protein
MRRVFASLPVLALVLTGCFRIELGIELNDDGSGRMSLLAAVDTSLAEQFGDAGGELANPFDEIEVDDLPSGATVEPYQDGDFEGVRVTVPFEAGDDVASTVERLFADLDDGDDGLTGEDGGFERFVLERDGDGWRFDAELSGTSADLGGSDDAFGAAFAQALLGDASFLIRLKLPGDVVEHNADEVGPDGELIWEIDLFEAGNRELSARSEPGSGGGSSGTVIAVVVVVGLLALAGGGAYYLSRRRPAAAA